MFVFFKNKNFVKISILFGISLILFFGFLFNKNLNIRKIKSGNNNELFIKKLVYDYHAFFEIKKISLNGRSRANLDSIKNIVNSNLINSKNIIEYDTNKIKNFLEKLNWINKVSIRRILPNKLIIKIKEHQEFAILNKGGKSFLISEEGKIIYEIKNPQAYKLIQLEGDFAVKNIDQIKEFFLDNIELKERISKIIIFSNNRWNLITNNILFKLPNKNKKEAIKQISKFYDLKNLEMVDLRFFEKKIYIKTNSKKIAMKDKK